MNSMKIYPVEQGIALEFEDDDNKHIVVLTPEDASRVAVNLITTLATVNVIANLAEGAKRAEAQEEFDRVRKLTEQGGLTAKGIPDLGKLRNK